MRYLELGCIGGDKVHDLPDETIVSTEAPGAGSPVN
jgi:hypothetical protein